jgi:hypothetical protein
MRIKRGGSQIPKIEEKEATTNDDKGENITKP